jgi:hypothetical protein
MTRRLVGILSSLLFAHLAVAERVLACVPHADAGAMVAVGHCGGMHATGATTRPGERTLRAAHAVAPECCSTLATCSAPVALMARTAPAAGAPGRAARLLAPASSGASITHAPDPPPPRV